MTADNIEVSYKIFKRSTSLFAITLVAILFKPVFNEAYHEFLDYLIALPILIAGVISLRGLYLGIKGSQNGLKNKSKRYFGIFGNLFYAGIIILLVIVIIVDIRKFIS